MSIRKRILTPSILKKTLYILALIGVFYIIFFIKESKSQVSRKIAHLAPLEKEYFENFFRYSYFVDSLGFVIFFDKPMSFISTESCKEKLTDGEDYMHLKHVLNKYRIKECCETWERFSTLFDMKNFSIIRRTYIGHSFIFFINHRNFEKMVSDHIGDFLNVFGSECTPKQILNGFIRNEDDVFEKIMHHDGLLGTLLGFGRDNAFEYMRRGGGQEMDGFADLPDSLDSKDILGPFFKVISDTDETQSLIQSYRLQRKYLSELYQNDDFLEMIFKKLTSNE